MSTNSSNDPIELDSPDDSKYLIFKLGKDLYGSPLIGIREVLETQALKPIPNTADYFLGLINVRGQIFGVVDLRIRFKTEMNEKQKEVLLIFDTDSGPVGAVVGGIESVISVQPEQLNVKVNIRNQVPIDYLLGALSHNGQIVTLIDLNKTLSNDDFVAIKSARVSNSG